MSWVVAAVSVGIGATVLGGAVSAYGADKSGKAQQGMYDYQAGVAQINKQIADQNADYAIKTGETQAQAEGMKTRAIIGTTRAAQGAGGLDVNKGSAVRVRESEAEIGEQNQAVVRADAAKRAYGFRVEAMQDTAQSVLDTTAGVNARKAAKYNVASSILGTVSSVSSKWLTAGTAGVGSSSGYNVPGDTGVY